jgi:hypothetical protein
VPHHAIELVADIVPLHDNIPPYGQARITAELPRDQMPASRATIDHAVDLLRSRHRAAASDRETPEGRLVTRLEEALVKAEEQVTTATQAKTKAESARDEQVRAGGATPEARQAVAQAETDLQEATAYRDHVSDLLGRARKDYDSKVRDRVESCRLAELARAQKEENDALEALRQGVVDPVTAVLVARQKVWYLAAEAERVHRDAGSPPKS